MQHLSFLPEGGFLKFGSRMRHDHSVEMTTESVKSILARVLREHYADTHRRMAERFGVSPASVGRWFRARPSVPSHLGTALIRAVLDTGGARATATLWKHEDRSAGVQVRAGQGVTVFGASDTSAGASQMLRVVTADGEVGWIAAMQLEDWRPTK